ncbi:hypothetical protein G6O67_000514 [Ophiocordyceps sinensis]|uniref:Heat-labile enterotoxin, A chain n=1 Tax=Ophiocordyceps sinensis TaxID=72228 RepID=A0A8H4VA25_9HYPO|nr:hypothetical protein G6O67_000514 [Ophiocordyceps sinensis]
MRWATIVISAAPLWLSWLASSNANPGAALLRRQSNRPDGFVFRGDSRSPREIRATGGFQPQGTDWQRHDSSFSIERHYDAGPNGCGLDQHGKPGFTFRTAYVSLAQQRETSEAYGTWLYEIRATPNMLDDGYPEGEVFALGGVQWRQIRRYVLMSNRADEAAWVDNPDYNVQLYERSANAVHCRVTADALPPELTGDSLDGDDSGREDESGGGFAAAIRFMDNSIMDALVGDFPPQFQRYPPRDDIPGPGDANEIDPPKDNQVGELIQHYVDLGAERLDQLFPRASQVVQQFLDEAEQGSCGVQSRSNKRSMGGLRTRDDKAKDHCCKILTKLKRTVRKGSRGKTSTGKGSRGKGSTGKGSTGKDSRGKGSRGKAATKPIVFYGDYLWPDEAKKQGGFLPRSTTPPGPTYDVDPPPVQGGEKVEIDWPTLLVPTYPTLGAAAKHAAEVAAKETKGFGGVVYAVHATPNMVSSGNDSAAVGGILWTQVLGWMQVPEGYSPPRQVTPRRAKLRVHFERAIKESNELFQQNKDYDAKFDRYNITVDVPQQFHTIEDLSAFMKDKGQAVGWRGGFPLFEPPQVIDGAASKAAKTSNAVAAPHEPGKLDKIGGYVKSHIWAIALLPAVAVLNFIPGLGEAADAAEVAALCADSVESIELAEVGGSSLGRVGTGLAQLLKNTAKLKVA